LSSSPSLASQPKRTVGWGGWVLGTITAILYVDLAFSGIESNRPSTLFAPVLWTGFTMAYMHVRFKRSGWAGFGKGILFGIVATLATAFLHIVMERLEGNQLVVRLVKGAAEFEPSLADRLEQAKNNGNDLLDDPAVKAKFRSALQQAIQVAPSGVLLAFDQARTDIVDPAKGGTAHICAELARGNSASLGGAHPTAWIGAMTGLFEGAAHGPRTVAKDDAGKFQQLLGQVLLEADPDNVIGDEAKLKSASEEALCDLYLRYTKRIHSLPADDAAGLMRYVMQANAAPSPASVH
jgi:hypothetical protein